MWHSTLTAVPDVYEESPNQTRYAQAFPSKSQTALATAQLLWNSFVLHYGFLAKIITA